MKTAARKTAVPDAIALLKGDHKLVDKIFSAFEKTDDQSRKEELADMVCKLLTAHATIEEELLYPQAHERLKDDDLVYEAEVEHATAKDLIAKIESMESGDQEFEATVKVLGEYIRHHVKEEESEMFPQLKRAKMNLRELGEQLNARKQELLGAEGIDETAATELATASTGGKRGKRSAAQPARRRAGNAKGARHSQARAHV